jgi:hypothetical protein
MPFFRYKNYFLEFVMSVLVILLAQEAEGLVTPIILWSCLDCVVKQGYVCLIV